MKRAETAKILTLEDARRGLQVRKADFCNHKGVIHVDEGKRILECDKCGAVLDPFDFIMMIGEEQEMYWNLYQDYKRQAEEAAERLKELQRQERNIKARIRNAGKKL